MENRSLEKDESVMINGQGAVNNKQLKVNKELMT